LSYAQATDKLAFDSRLRKGRRHSLDARHMVVRRMRLQPPEGAHHTLADIVWDAETLRLLLQQMLKRHRVGASHLLTAWDRDSDGFLSYHEFAEEIRQAVRPSFTPGGGVRSELKKGEQKLWEREVQPAIKAAFADIDRVHGSVQNAMGAGFLDVVELQAWLTQAPAGAKNLPHVKNRRSGTFSLGSGYSRFNTKVKLPVGGARGAPRAGGTRSPRSVRPDRLQPASLTPGDMVAPPPPFAADGEPSALGGEPRQLTPRGRTPRSRDGTLSALSATGTLHLGSARAGARGGAVGGAVGGGRPASVLPRWEVPMEIELLPPLPRVCLEPAPLLRTPRHLGIGTSLALGHQLRREGWA
jgi:hypothetical protein